MPTLALPEGTLFEDSKLDTLALGEGYPGSVLLTNDENIVQSSSELVASRITNVNDIEGTGVFFNVNNGSNTTSIASTSDHAQVSSLELDEVHNLTSLQVNLDSVVNLDGRVVVTDGASVVGGDERNFLLGELLKLNTAQLVLGLLIRSQTVEDETSLGVVHQTELVTGFLHSNHIHETTRESLISPDLPVNLTEAIHYNLLALSHGEGVLKPISEDQAKGDTLTELVRSSARTRCPDAIKFAKHPVMGCE